MFLSAIYRYPLKSGQAETLEASSVGALGLTGDRRWMVVREDNGQFLTQRAWPQMTQIGALHQHDGSLILQAPGMGALHVAVPDDEAPLRGVTLWRDLLQVPDAGEAAAAWLSALLGKALRLVHCPAQRARFLPSGYGSVDDRAAFPDGFPLLLIGQASLDELSRRIGRPMAMLRFRPNLVVEGAEAFAEDTWTRIRIGDTTLRVLKPSVRCILVTLDPASGARSPDKEPLTTLKTFRSHDGNVLFGQNLAADGEGVVARGMPVHVLG